MSLNENSTKLLETVTSANSLQVKLQLVMDILLVTLTVILMLSFGCSITLKDLRHHLRHPGAVTMAVVCHFLVVPYLAFGMRLVFNLSEFDTASFTLLATCPAGGIGNIFTFGTEGNEALSVIITAVTTVLAIAFMPLNLWLFTQSSDYGNISMPYAQTAISLVTILVPVMLGMVILRKWPVLAKWLSRVGLVLASVMILTTVGISSYLYPQMYQSPWRTWAAAAALPLSSFTISYSLGLLMRMPDDIRRTLGVTASAKSIALCLTVIVLSFPSGVYLKCLVVPELYSIFMIAQLSVIVCIYRGIKWCSAKYFLGDNETALQRQTSTTEVSGSGLTSYEYSTEAKNRTITRRMSETNTGSTDLSLASYTLNDNAL